ncbi:DNA-binding response regulator [Flavobacterium arcticum]|uniref:DNA-binding response regulator n=1 Tax=Flavobacterium arcticum TaxID=1784713 RepID=A0A345HAC6_9FLAO|nr:response regulator transcription factor [Flavobacterium arcticum]AXG73536.1 DNA-binding response regulator [Flavobacterium arcticum]KAF2513326.1 response regulator transcription factor [Flavobacterium arcticum]
MNILISGNHPFTIDVFEKTLHENFIDLNISKTYCYKIAFKMISKNAMDPYELVVFDLNTMINDDLNFTYIVEIIVLLKKRMSKCKIIVITSRTEILHVYEIVRKIKPTGLAVKTDVSLTELKYLFETVLKGSNYQSFHVKQCLNEIWDNQLMIEDYNRQILLLLSQGYRVGELSEVISLSKSAIQKRIYKLKKAFNTGDEQSLIREVRLKGYV